MDEPNQPVEANKQEQIAVGPRGLPERADVFKGELLERGHWVVAYIDGGGRWTTETQKAIWRGHTIWIIPVTTEYRPAVAMRAGNEQGIAACEEIVSRFVSALSWAEDSGYMIRGIGGGSLPFPMTRDSNRSVIVCAEFDLSYLPEPTHANAPLALALMREGRGLNHPAYAFLSFFRVLEVVFQNPNARKKWIAKSIDTATAFEAKEIIARLIGSGITDVGRHLFESGRCAIAHANKIPIIDPDKPNDMRRLSEELPLIRALAKQAIEEELGVQTRQTIFKEHLYELAGFKPILGTRIVEALTRGEQIAAGELVNLPNIDVRIRRRAPYEPLKSLEPREVSQREKNPALALPIRERRRRLPYRAKLRGGETRIYSLAGFGDQGQRKRHLSNPDWGYQALSTRPFL